MFCRYLALLVGSLLVVMEETLAPDHVYNWSVYIEKEWIAEVNTCCNVRQSPGYMQIMTEDKSCVH